MVDLSQMPRSILSATSCINNTRTLTTYFLTDGFSLTQRVQTELCADRTTTYQNIKDLPYS